MFRASTAAGLVVSLSVSSASGQRTFSQGIPNFPFTAAEQEIYNYILSTTAAMGTINHFWSTACGGRQINYATEGGIAVYRIYIDGELNASIEFTPRSAVGYGPFDPAAGSASLSSLHEPWSTDLWGKLSDMDGFFFKVKIPFYRSIRVTAQLPAGVAAFNVYTIIRGVESDDTGLPALSLPGYGALPLGTRMLQVRRGRGWAQSARAPAGAHGVNAFKLPVNVAPLARSATTTSPFLISASFPSSTFRAARG